MKTAHDRLNRYAGGAFGSCSASTIKFTPTGSISATTIQAAIAELDREKQFFPQAVTIGMAATSQSLTAGTAYYSVYPLSLASSIISSIEWFISLSDAASLWYQSIYTYAASGSITKLATVSYQDTGSSAGYHNIALASPLTVNAERVFIQTLIVGGAARLASRSSTLTTDVLAFSGTTGLSAPNATESAVRTALTWEPYILLR